MTERLYPVPDFYNLVVPVFLLDEVYGPGTITRLITHGGPYQIRKPSGWSDRCGLVSRHSVYVTRLKPLDEPLLTLPSINWDAVPPHFGFMATDENLKTYLFEDHPQLGNHMWFATGGRHISASEFNSFVLGTCDWRHSLVKRPSA